MAHPNQITFCEKVKVLFPDSFKRKDGLDGGSLDINGNNRYLFTDCKYIGIDVGEGNNVDKVCPIHKYKGRFDTIISTECFEHDMYYKESLINIIKMLRKGGLFLFTCATTERVQHGTTSHSPQSAPLINDIPEWKDYYKNLTESDIKEAINIEVFKDYHFETNGMDLYFWGIKR